MEYKKAIRISPMKLIDAIKLQFYVMLSKRNFRISFTLMMLYAIGVYLVNVYVNLNTDISATISASSLFVGNEKGDYYRYLEALFPFIVLFPFSFSYLNDKKTKMGCLLQTKMGNRNYYLSQMITCFLGGTSILFIPLILNLILTSTTFLETGYTYFGLYNTSGYCNTLLGNDTAINTVNSGMTFLSLYILSPFLYNFLYTLIISLFAGLISIFGLACSFYVKKYTITLFIINYLLFLIGSVVNNILYYSTTYLNTNFLDYVSVNTQIGKSYLFFFAFCSILFIFSVRKMHQMSQLDQL